MDRAIVDAARRGDRAAFDALVRTEVDGVYRLALAVLGDEADARDATQETFVAAWRELGALRDPDRFDAWLRRIAVNAARMALRGHRRRRVREIPSTAVESLGDRFATDPTDARTDAIVLRAALVRLDADQRILLALAYAEGRSMAEIGAILGVPAGTVKSRLHTARRSLGALLEDGEGGR